MSQAVKAAMRATHDLKPTERMVVLVIAAHQNQEGDAWPSVQTIADHVGCSTRTVQRALAKLVQLGRLVVRQVANVATRVYRLVTGQPNREGESTLSPGSAPVGGDSERQGVTESAPGGDTRSVSPEVEKTKEKNYRAPARDWRRFIPKSKNPTPPQRQPYGYPERRGAALPVADRAEQCPSHRGSPRGNCGPCRSEALAGGR
ncbi:helix-turn-helix domain-containing protein [Micromonospora sp. ATA32]|nr:helix-turn-helix domain-containing protein [Micromonospora sp. ATA32]